jgi:hypothetical protein
MVALVRRIMDTRHTDDELPERAGLLVRSTGCPENSDLILWPKHEMKAAEIVESALARRPGVTEDRR